MNTDKHETKRFIKLLVWHFTWLKTGISKRMFKKWMKKIIGNLVLVVEEDQWRNYQRVCWNPQQRYTFGYWVSSRSRLYGGLWDYIQSAPGLVGNAGAIQLSFLEVCPANFVNVCYTYHPIDLYRYIPKINKIIIIQLWSWSRMQIIISYACPLSQHTIIVTALAQRHEIRSFILPTTQLIMLR